MPGQGLAPPQAVLHSTSPLLGPDSEPEVSKDFLVSPKEEHEENLEESIFGTQIMMIQKCQENNTHVQKLQEVKTKTEQLKASTKTEDDKIEQIHSDYAKSLNDLKEVGQMQALKIEKYKCVL